MTQEWVKEWQAEEIDLPSEFIGWMRSRPDSIKELLLEFPPQCLVQATRALQCLAPETTGFLAGYNENGHVIVVQSPDGELSARCDPYWLEVVGYRKGLTSDDVRAILEGDD